MLTVMTAASIAVTAAVSACPNSIHLTLATALTSKKEIDMEIMIDRQKFNTFIEDFSRDYCTTAPFFPRSQACETTTNLRLQGDNGFGAAQADRKRFKGTR